MSDFDNGTETESTPSIPESGIGVTPPMPEILDDKLFGDDDSYSEEESESHQEEPEPEENTENEDLVINIDMPTLKQATDDRPDLCSVTQRQSFQPGFSITPNYLR